MEAIGDIAQRLTARAMDCESVTNSYRCEKCRDVGYIDLGDSVTECECLIRGREKDRMERLFESAKIPARYRDKTLDNFDATLQPRAHKIATEYVKTWPKKDGESLFFAGPVSTGKTHLARAILSGLIRRHGVTALAVTVPSLMDDLRPGASEEFKAEQIQTLKTVPLLLLDDLGAQRNTEWVTERLFVIVNARYDELLPTIFTSNVYLENLRNIDGWDRLVDRIVEMSTAIKMNDRNYRLRNRTEGSEK